VERSLLSGLVAFRWAAWIWMTAVVVALGEELARPWVVILAVAAAFAVTVGSTVLLRRNQSLLLTPAAVLVELGVGLGVVVVDGWAYKHGHVFGSSQTLGIVWPLTGVLAAGLVAGPRAGGLAGLAFSVARYFDAVANATGSLGGHRVLSLLSTGLVYGLTGAVMGYITQLLRQAREEVAAATEREKIARTLHDGVLQTLAAIERRTQEPDIARLAREQERELRHYLFSPIDKSAVNAGLAVALRAAVEKFENTYDSYGELLVVGEIPPLPQEQVDALAGAVGEALTNAGKHGRATRATVYIETGDTGDVFCSVKDNGPGFDPASTPEGVGLTRSIRGRIDDVGGRVEIRSAPGEGAEVCLWLA
jgi:signal transduction histidine kinase